MRKKYIVHPGKVFSSDHDIHILGFRRLCDLYGVNPAECLNADSAMHTLGHDTSGMIHLYPDRSGRYKILKQDGGT